VGRKSFRVLDRLLVIEGAVEVEVVHLLEIVAHSDQGTEEEEMMDIEKTDMTATVVIVHGTTDDTRISG
jgi:hypothetical protein